MEVGTWLHSTYRQDDEDITQHSQQLEQGQNSNQTQPNDQHTTHKQQTINRTTVECLLIDHLLTTKAKC